MIFRVEKPAHTFFNSPILYFLTLSYIYSILFMLIYSIYI